jgi:hypothetical protein
MFQYKMSCYITCPIIQGVFIFCVLIYKEFSSWSLVRSPVPYWDLLSCGPGPGTIWDAGRGTQDTGHGTYCPLGPGCQPWGHVVPWDLGGTGQLCDQSCQESHGTVGCTCISCQLSAVSLLSPVMYPHILEQNMQQLDLLVYSCRDLQLLGNRVLRPKPLAASYCVLDQ